MEILELLFRPETLALLIPLSAITGAFYMISLKIKAKAQQRELSNADRQLLQQSLADNQNVKERLANLESIITSMDKEILALGSSRENPDDPQKRVKQLSDKLSNEDL